MHDAKPRLLMLTHRFPYPPNRGDRIRAYHLLREMVSEFSVTLGSFVDEPVKQRHYQYIQSLCEQVVISQSSRFSRCYRAIKSVAKNKSITEGMFASDAFADQIKSIHQRRPFDSVLVFCSSMFPYVDQPEFNDARIVVDLVDVDSLKWGQMGTEAAFPKDLIYRRESKRVRNIEQRIADSADGISLVSALEAKLYRRAVRVPDSQTVAGISNGVDAGFFQPTSAKRFLAHDCTTSKPLRLVFTGVMNYTPNVEGVDWFCRKVLPDLQKELNVSLKIVGRSPNSRVMALQQRPGVEVVGPVPDVRPYLEEADIAISPLKLARGIQNKVLEAMAMKCPVVCTTPSAQGISDAHGVHYLIADSESQWCTSLKRLAGDPDYRREIALAARRLVVDEFSWSARLKPMMQLLRATKQELVNV